MFSSDLVLRGQVDFWSYCHNLKIGIGNEFPQPWPFAECDNHESGRRRGVLHLFPFFLEWLLAPPLALPFIFPKAISVSFLRDGFFGGIYSFLIWLIAAILCRIG